MRILEGRRAKSQLRAIPSTQAAMIEVLSGLDSKLKAGSLLTRIPSIL
jgi:hypothetical protein